MDDNSDEPFASIADLCRISSSQEELLKRCRFAGEAAEEDDDESLSDKNDDDIPLESTGIMMISPPETPPNENKNDYNIPCRDNDVFHTPPEESLLAASQETVANVDNCNNDWTVEGAGNDEKIDVDDDSRAVDLGRDTDLGFSEAVESTERIEIDSGTYNSSHGEDLRVLKRELDSSNRLCEQSPGKKVKFVDNNLGLVTPQAVVKTLERVVKSMEKLKPSSTKSKLFCENLVLETSRDGLEVNGAENLEKSVENSSPGNSLKNQRIQEVNVGNNKESSGDSSAKRKLEFCTQTVECNSEDNVAVLGQSGGRMIEDGIEEIEDSDKERYLDTNSVEKQKERVAKSIDDIDKFRYTGPSSSNSLQKKKDVRAKRALPMSMCGNDVNAEEDMSPDGIPSRMSNKELTLTLLDVLRMLSEEYTRDPALENLSIVEVAKRRGMTFP